MTGWTGPSWRDAFRDLGLDISGLQSLVLSTLTSQVLLLLITSFPSHFRLVKVLGKVTHCHHCYMIWLLSLSSVFFRRHVSGLHLPDLHFQVSAFCDDIVVAVSNQEDFDSVEFGLSHFEKASNAKLNSHKCETLPLTDTSRALLPGLGKWLSWDLVFQHLGVPFHPRCFPLPQGWFHSLLDKLSKTVTSWQRHKIFLVGKVHVINSRLLSKLWYLGYFVSFPPWFFKALSRI